MHTPWGPRPYYPPGGQPPYVMHPLPPRPPPNQPYMMMYPSPQYPIRPPPTQSNNGMQRPYPDSRFNDSDNEEFQNDQDNKSGHEEQYYNENDNNNNNYREPYPRNPDNRRFAPPHNFDPYNGYPPGHRPPFNYPPNNAPMQQYYDDSRDPRDHIQNRDSNLGETNSTPSNEENQRESADDSNQHKIQLENMRSENAQLQSELELVQKKVHSLSRELEEYKQYALSFNATKKEWEEEKANLETLQVEWNSEKAQLEQKNQVTNQKLTNIRQVWESEKKIWLKEKEGYLKSLENSQAEILAKDKQNDETLRQWIEEKGVYRRDNRVLSDKLKEQRDKTAALTALCRSIQLGGDEDLVIRESPLFSNDAEVDSENKNRQEMLEWRAREANGSTNLTEEHNRKPDPVSQPSSPVAPSSAVQQPSPQPSITKSAPSTPGRNASASSASSSTSLAASSSTTSSPSFFSSEGGSENKSSHAPAQKHTNSNQVKNRHRSNKDYRTGRRHVYYRAEE